VEHNLTWRGENKTNNMNNSKSQRGEGGCNTYQKWWKKEQTINQHLWCNS